MLLFILGLHFTTFSQTKLSGIVLDEKTRLPVQYANVFLELHGVGVSSNSHGAYEVIVPKKSELNDSICFSCMGYQTIKYSIRQLQSLKTVFLKEKVIELDELVISNRSLSVNDILRIAFGKMSKNHRSKPYQLQTFYRHYCSENNIYGRLIEAAVSLYDPKGHKKLYTSPETKIEIDVTQIRKSFDYTKNFDEHDAISINSTIKYDISSYETMLHSYPDEWKFSIVDTTFYNGSYVWIIGYNYDFMKNKALSVYKVKASGKVYVSISDFAILRVEEKQVNAMNKEFENHSYLLEWEVNYQKYLGDYYLSYVKESGWSFDEKLGNDKEIVSKKDHRFHVEMMVNAIVLDGFKKFKGNEPTKEVIDQMKYDPEFWNHYGVLRNTPLDDKVIVDLENIKSLKDQFED